MNDKILTKEKYFLIEYKYIWPFRLKNIECKNVFLQHFSNHSRGVLSKVFIIALSGVFPFFNQCYSISFKLNGGRNYNDFSEEFSFNLKVCLYQQTVKALYRQLLIRLLVSILRLKIYHQKIQEGIRLSKLKVGYLYSQ